MVTTAKSESMRFFRRCHFSKAELANLKKLIRPSGTSLILPYDQFIEHDNRHIDPNPEAADPGYICRLAKEGGYNGLAVHYGVAKRYWTQIDKSVPLILKVNGKTSIPDQSRPLSVHTSFVEDAAAIGAAAVGYTMYYGSPRQDEDLPQLAKVRRACEKYGLPLIVWAYPRGADVDAKGGKDSSYMVESAVRMAMEMGATIIKANLPKAMKAGYAENEGIPAVYRKIEAELLGLSGKEQKLQRAKRAVIAAQGIPVLFSGGSEIGDEDLFENARACIDAGCFGFIFGRNMWKREWKDALETTRKFQKMLDNAP